MTIAFKVNGAPRQIEADPRALLLDVLREELGLRGTKYGCGEGECGACTVLLDGQAVNACLTTAGQAHGAEILTIEAMPEDPVGRAVIDGFVRAGAVQCGFCTPGLVLAAQALLAREAAPDVETIRRALGGNLCRCTGYAKIVEGVTLAAPAIEPTKRPNGQGAPRSASAGAYATRDYARPSSLEEALSLLADPEAGWKVLAGGTDLLVRNEHRLHTMPVLDLGALDALCGITEAGEATHVGALTTYTDIVKSPLLQQWAPALVSAAREVGGEQIQNMGTLGGNLVNASPAADGVPPLFVLEASLVLRSVRGERVVPVADFATGPGRTCLAPDELLVAIRLPKQQHDGRRVTFFDKVGPRKAQTIAKASVAFSGWLHHGRLRHVRLALGAVAPTVIAAPATARLLMSAAFDEALLARAGESAASECAPIDDIRSTAAYRRRLVRGLLVRGLSPYV